MLSESLQDNYRPVLEATVLDNCNKEMYCCGSYGVHTPVITKRIPSHFVEEQ